MNESIPKSVPIMRTVLLLKLSDLDFYYEDLEERRNVKEPELPL
jgi:hypothetical protein